MSFQRRIKHERWIYSGVMSGLKVPLQFDLVRVRDANATGIYVPYVFWCESTALMPYGDASQISTNCNYLL